MSHCLARSVLRERKGADSCFGVCILIRHLDLAHLFGLPGTLNDISVLNRSPIFRDLMEGKAPEVEFTVNGNVYKKAYYLADGIYPDWETLIKSVTNGNKKERVYSSLRTHRLSGVFSNFLVLCSFSQSFRNPYKKMSSVHSGSYLHVGESLIFLHSFGRRPTCKQLFTVQ